MDDGGVGVKLTQATGKDIGIDTLLASGTEGVADVSKDTGTTGNITFIEVGQQVMRLVMTL